MVETILLAMKMVDDPMDYGQSQIKTVVREQIESLVPPEVRTSVRRNTVELNTKIQNLQKTSEKLTKPRVDVEQLKTG